LKKLLLLVLLLTPPSLSEIIRVNLAYVSLLGLPDKKVHGLEIIVNNGIPEEIFDSIYKLCIIQGILPTVLMFEIKPPNSEKFLRMYQLSQDMLKAL